MQPILNLACSYLCLGEIVEEAVKAKLEIANKFIFVKQYRQAEELLDQLLESDEGRREVIIHLRRIELAAKLSKIPELQRRYNMMQNDVRYKDLAEICLAFFEQHRGGTPQVESIARFQEILKAGILLNFAASSIRRK